MNLADYIRDVPNFPHDGVVYKDITPLLQDKVAFETAVNKFVEHFREQKIDLVMGIEARGFLLASAVAYALHSGLIIARKPGKLPHDIIASDEYITEYSTDNLHIHKDSIKPGQTVLIIDDVLATGGTSMAAYQLVKELGGEMLGFGYLIELAFINGRKNLKNLPLHSLITY